MNMFGTDEMATQVPEGAQAFFASYSFELQPYSADAPIVKELDHVFVTSLDWDVVDQTTGDDSAEAYVSEIKLGSQRTVYQHLGTAPPRWGTSGPKFPESAFGLRRFIQAKSLHQWQVYARNGSANPVTVTLKVAGYVLPGC